MPTLSRQILDNAPEVNLVGVAVGDPCTDNKAQQDSMDMLWHGAFGQRRPAPIIRCLWSTAPRPYYTVLLATGAPPLLYGAFGQRYPAPIIRCLWPTVPRPYYTVPLVNDAEAVGMKRGFLFNG